MQSSELARKNEQAADPLYAQMEHRRACLATRFSASLFLFQPDSVSSEDDQLWTLVGRDDVRDGKTQHAFNLGLHESESAYRVHASCATDVMNYEQLLALLCEFNETVEELVRSPNVPAFSNYDEIFIETLAVTPESLVTNLNYDTPVPKAITSK